MILKAIHNFSRQLELQMRLFPNVKDNDFESNSQLLAALLHGLSGCFRMSKIMILKAIHNLVFARLTALTLFPNVKDNDFESNSQLTLFMTLELPRCFRMSKIMILKAIHKYNRKNEKCNFEKRKIHFLRFFNPILGRYFTAV